MIRLLAMGRCVCGLEVVGIGRYSFPGGLWTENACIGACYWDSRETKQNKTKRLRTARPLLGWTPPALTPSPSPTSGLVCLLSETVIPPVGPIAR